jgi:hypothetical protein
MQSADNALSRHLVDASSTLVLMWCLLFLPLIKLFFTQMAIMVIHLLNWIKSTTFLSIIETGEEMKNQTRIDIDWVTYFDNLVNSTKLSDSSEGHIGKVSTSQFTCR